MLILLNIRMHPIDSGTLCHEVREAAGQPQTHFAMDNRVYYGEYSLKHWIDLMLKENIVLPDYQRHFVWSEEDVETLIETLKEKLFVPPITIGAFKDQGQSKNLILDGQQRLTSILLAYLGKFPNENTFLDDSIVKFADDNGEDEDVVDETRNILKWTFKKLVEAGKTKEEIIKKITDINYRTLAIAIPEKFFDETFLGFSYLVPYLADKKKQQKYYSSVFRYINIQGKPLLPQESRQSLYYLNDELFDFFDPGFIQPIVVGATTKSRLDFVRYLSLLSQYHNNGNAGGVARGYKSAMENYYGEYILAVAENTKSKFFGKFSDLFPDKIYKDRFEVLEKTINALAIPKSFSSIIDADMWFFGLIYTVVIENKKIDDSAKGDLRNEVLQNIADYRKDADHARNPNAFMFLRTRIATSINTYEKYAQ